MPLDESVLVIPTSRFREFGHFLGFRAADDALRAAVLNHEAFAFRPRSEVETDPGFKQLIPYVVLKCGDLLFHYRRGSSGSESRLHALRSIGIGGHISEDDARGDGDPYESGMRRELYEEAAIVCKWKERFLGFINDDRTLVGSVHLGVVHLFELETPDVRAREDALADAGLAPLAELVSQADQFETWSQFVLAELSRE
jgi:predicted NUDIX family phosphoesterase